MMKTFAVVFLALTFAAVASAQEETLICGNIESGGFGGPAVKVTTINGEGAVMIGGRGGWIINHTFVLGGGGYGLVNDISATVPDAADGFRYVDLGYGGLDLEYITTSDRLVHLSIGLLVGGGGVRYKGDRVTDDRRSMDGFFVAEPSLTVNLNVTRFFRIGAGASYRYVNGVNGGGITSDADLSGASAMLTLKFGKF
jgi:hypothetical protein